MTLMATSTAFTHSKKTLSNEPTQRGTYQKQETLDAEKVLGDDVSHVRTGDYDGIPDESTADELMGENEAAAVEHSYSVVDENQQVNCFGPEMRDQLPTTQPTN